MSNRKLWTGTGIEFHDGKSGTSVNWVNFSCGSVWCKMMEKRPSTTTLDEHNMDEISEEKRVFLALMQIIRQIVLPCTPLLSKKLLSWKLALLDAKYWVNRWKWKKIVLEKSKLIEFKSGNLSRYHFSVIFFLLSNAPRCRSTWGGVWWRDSWRLWSNFGSGSAPEANSQESEWKHSARRCSESNLK